MEHNLDQDKFVALIFRITILNCRRILNAVWNRLNVDPVKDQILAALGIDGVEKLLALSDLSANRLLNQVNLPFKVRKFEYRYGQLVALDEICQLLARRGNKRLYLMPEVDEKRLMNFILFNLGSDSYNVIKDSQINTPGQFLDFRKEVLGPLAVIEDSAMLEIRDLQSRIANILNFLSQKPSTIWDGLKLPLNYYRKSHRARHLTGTLVLEIVGHEGGVIAVTDHKVRDHSAKIQERNRNHPTFNFCQKMPFKGDPKIIKHLFTVDEESAARMFQETMRALDNRLQYVAENGGLDRLEKVIALSDSSGPRLNKCGLPKMAHKLGRRAWRILKKYHLSQGMVPITDHMRLDHERIMNFIDWSLSLRTLKGVKSLGVRTLENFMSLTPDRFDIVPNFGPVSIDEVLFLQAWVRKLTSPPSIEEPLQSESDPEIREATTRPEKYRVKNPEDEVRLFQLFMEGLSVRSRNVLDRKNISSLRNVVQLDLPSVEKWTGLGRKSVSEIWERRNATIEILEAGYPDTDYEKLTPTNLLIATKSFDCSNPYLGLMTWLDGVVSRMRNCNEAKWVFASRYGLLGIPARNLNDVANILNCTREAARLKLKKVDLLANQEIHRRKLLPLMDDIETAILAAGGVSFLNRLVSNVLVRGDNGSLLAHAEEFLRWISKFPEWEARGIIFKKDLALISKEYDRLL